MNNISSTYLSSQLPIEEANNWNKAAKGICYGALVLGFGAVFAGMGLLATKHLKLGLIAEISGVGTIFAVAFVYLCTGNKKKDVHKEE